MAEQVVLFLEDAQLFGSIDEIFNRSFSLPTKPSIASAILRLHIVLSQILTIHSCPSGVFVIVLSKKIYEEGR